MYSMLLMAAVSTGGDAQAFGGRFAGCTGCSGAAYYAQGCYGTYSSCSGCAGCTGWSSCSGCSGSACYGGGCGGRPGLFGRLFHRNSCHGSSCTGCSGSSCSGCSGSSCHGCSGSACYGGGCYGGGCYGTAWANGYSIAPPAVVTSAVAIGATPVIPSAELAASITVELPATAVLLVDGQPTKGDGANRQFHTPALPPGQTFYYEMTATVSVNGQPVTENIRVLVRGGDQLTRSFGKLIAMTESKDAPKMDAPKEKVAAK